MSITKISRLLHFLLHISKYTFFKHLFTSDNQIDICPVEMFTPKITNKNVAIFILPNNCISSTAHFEK